MTMRGYMRLAVVVPALFFSCSNVTGPAPGTPSAPAIQSVTPGNGQVTVTWAPPGSPGNSPISGYTISATPGGVIAVAPGAARSMIVEGLQNGATYTFTVAAKNAAGSSPASTPSSAVVPGTVPDTALAADSAPGTLTMTGIPGNATNAVFQGLSNGTTYTFTVTAINASGPGAPSGASNPVTPFGLPGAPTNVTGVPGNGQATVHWVAAPSNGSAITSNTIVAMPGSITVNSVGATTTVVVNGLTNGTTYTFTVTATNAAGNGPASAPSAGVTPSASAPPPMGPLVVSSTNSHYFVDPTGKPVLLTGSHTWNTFQDLSQSTTTPYPNLLDFNAYVSFLKAPQHNHSVTILWRKDLPTYFNWSAGGTWHDGTWPWPRTGAGTASDGLPKFDLSQFDQTYFDRLRARALQLQQNGIYAIVQLFDGLQLADNRGAGDGYPFTGANNVNGVDDGFAGGNAGVNSMNASYSGITGIYAVQDAYVKKIIDTLNDLPNVLWEFSEEAPIESLQNGSPTWSDHMISLIHTYEAGKPLQHPVGITCPQTLGNANIYSSKAEWVAPCDRTVSTNNQGKVVINDSDHTYYGSMWTDTAQQRRNYVWENFANGAQVIFMDPYVIDWAGRNACTNPVSGVCSAPVTNASSYPEDTRVQMGYTLMYANKMGLLAMTPQPAKCSTGYCLASTTEYLVYAPNGGNFTVNLAGAPATLNIEWFDPSTGATTTPGTVPGGSTQQFTPPFSGDAVLYLH